MIILLNYNSYKTHIGTDKSLTRKIKPTFLIKPDAI